MIELGLSPWREVTELKELQKKILCRPSSSELVAGLSKKNILMDLK
jgi:hypothetical protein